MTTDLSPAETAAAGEDGATTFECPLCRRHLGASERVASDSLDPDLVSLVVANTPGWPVAPGPVPRLRRALPVRPAIPPHPRSGGGGDVGGGDPPDAGADRGPRRVPRARGHHRVPRRRLLRPSRPRRAPGPHRPVRRHHQRAAAPRGHRAAGQLQLARNDDLRGRVRERPPLQRLLPRRRLRGAPGAREGRPHEPHPAREHPPRTGLGDPQPPALRHPDRERQLRRRLRGLLPRRTGCPRPRTAPPAAASWSARRSATRGICPATRCCLRLPRRRR